MLRLSKVLQPILVLAVIVFACAKFIIYEEDRRLSKRYAEKYLKKFETVKKHGKSKRFPGIGIRISVISLESLSIHNVPDGRNGCTHALCMTLTLLKLNT